MKLFIIQRSFRDGRGNGAQVHRSSSKFGCGVSTIPSVEVYIVTAEDADAVKKNPLVLRWLEECKDFRETNRQVVPDSAADRWEDIAIAEIPHEVVSIKKEYFSPFLPTEFTRVGLDKL